MTSCTARYVIAVSILTLLGTTVLSANEVLGQNQTSAASKQLLDDPTAPPLAINTDSESYAQGDTVIINGVVKEPKEGTQLLLRILDSQDNIIHVEQLPPAEDGSFTLKVPATGPLWKAAGNYTIHAKYGAQPAKTQFSFAGGSGEIGDVTKPTEGTYTLEVEDHGAFDLPYIIKGGTVENISVDFESLALVIDIESTADKGSLVITLPRDVIDAREPPPLSEDEKMLGITPPEEEFTDTGFIVLVDDGAEANFKETQTDKDSRTLSIKFSENNSQIEIIGTKIIPEFGPIAALVLAGSIVALIAFSMSRSKKSLFLQRI